jgi:hypothetical protein
MMPFLVQIVQVVQAVQTPSVILPATRGRKDVGLERSEAVEPSEAIERIEQFFMRSSTPTLHHSNP